ncbi:MAG: class I SAM-dependent methyltransferase [Caldimonas sp.]
MPSVKLAWPAPALLAWAGCWAAFVALRAAATPLALALVLATLLGAAVALSGATPWRRVFIGCGFPLSLAASGLAGGVPAWAWLAPLAALALVYPLNAWRDAPVFPTPHGALRGLGAQLALADGARVLDAGCGLGDALLELHREFPRAAVAGVEWSWLLRLACAWRCRFATVRRADLWLADWSGFDLVYVFQRPDSMQRVADKAARDLRPGAWLASLEFEIATLRPARVFACPDGRSLWLYHAPLRARHVPTATPPRPDSPGRR